jgi:NAD(P)-dependent dehydrogenase (short-subunit alcohol dehydrogenase family)
MLPGSGVAVNSEAARASTSNQGGCVMGLLEGKAAIVTGAGRGIGRAEALLLASEGARVVVNDVGASLSGESSDATPAQQVVDEIVAAGGQAVANYDDVSSWKGAQSLVDQAVDTFGSLDILVNNAGILRDKMSFNIEESDWDDVIRVHLKGHFATSHFAARYWRDKAKSGQETSGRIINTSSEAGLFGSAGQANYAAAKGGIAALTLVLARELGRYGVTSNAIAPRARTRMTQSAFGGLEPKEGQFDEWAPENVAPVVGWLATDAAADVSGWVFVIFGGKLHAMAPYHSIGSLEKDSRWTVAELVESKAKLFGDTPSGPPPFDLGL